MGILDGKAAVVTGGGRGIGRGHCLHLAANGASVVVNDIDLDEAKKVCDEIAGKGGKALGGEGPCGRHRTVFGVNERQSLIGIVGHLRVVALKEGQVSQVGEGSSPQFVEICTDTDGVADEPATFSQLATNLHVGG